MFAYFAAAYRGGYRAGGLGGSVESVFGTQGIWSAAPAQPGSFYPGGICDDPGAGPVRLEWQDPYAAAPGISSLRSLTVSCLVTNEVPWVAADAYIFGRRDSLTGNVRGMALGNKNFGANPGWLVEVSDGVGQSNLQTELGQSVQTQFQMDLVTAVYDQNSNLSIWINDQLATVAGGAANPNATGLGSPLDNAIRAIRAFNDSGNTQQFDGAICAAFVWNRALTQQEIGAMASDPYDIWARPFEDEFETLGLSSGLPEGNCCGCSNIFSFGF